ncbi:hypothetical protein HQ560_14435, partial [bacterium]|nr:hypothetical protein [bacterium]
FTSVADGDGRAIRFRAPGRYSGANQSLRLKPDTAYRLEGRVRGAAGIYLRARTNLPGYKHSVPHTGASKPSDSYEPVAVPFRTGPDGRALIILGNTEALGAGDVFLADLRVLREPAFDAVGPPIPLSPTETTVVKKLRVADCRALKGFLGVPVDGTTHSRGWDGGVWEYNQRGAGAGVGYAYRGNDGLHITLADAGGFHAVLIRGGAQVKVYRDCPRYDEPDGGVLIHEFLGRTRRARAWFTEPVAARTVSFFGLQDGRLADVGFFRVTKGAPGRPSSRVLSAAGPGSAGTLRPRLEARFGKEDRRTVRLAPPSPETAPIRAEKGRWLHLVGAPFEAETPLAALGLTLALAADSAPLAFTAVVQDPLNARRQLLGADFTLARGATAHVVLDFPDQIAPTRGTLWLSLKFSAAVTLRAVTVGLHTTDAAEARSEALAYRKFLLRTCFVPLSEARPWMRWYDDRQMEKGLADESRGDQLQELVETLQHCKRLGPKDDVVRQYDEWIFQSHRERKKQRIPLEPRIGRAPPAPDWAVVARQAWLTAREVPAWWLAHRMTPTGEFGGQVGDDSDMYQNYADFPMLESGGVAAAVKDGARRLMALAETETLEQGLNRRTMDPLHAYEEGVNHEAILAWWDYGDPVAFERCIVAARSTEALTTLTPKGHRHFKSQLCGSADLRMDRKTDVDGHAHPLMWHPTLEVAWYNANPRALDSLRQWADGWLDHMQPGKYATGVEVATEKVVATTDRPLYGGYGGLGSAFLFLYWITDDAKYAEPFFEAFRRGSRNTSPHLVLPELIHRHGLGFLGGKLHALARGEGASETLVTGDKRPLIEALKADIAHLQRFPHMYTAAEQYTDRIFLNAIRNAAVAYTGGYASRNKLHHTHAVSWEGFGTDYAALVLRAGRGHLKALVYSFADKPMQGRMRLWTLDHGEYRLTFGPDADGDDAMDGPERTETLNVLRATAVPLTLPPRRVSVVELRQTKRLDDIRLRADLALSQSEIRIKEDRVWGVAHNIGSKRVASFVAALIDSDGKVLSRVTLGPLDAPLDLVPRRLSFQLRGLPADPAGCVIALDPLDLVPEIHEGNNRASAPSR